MNVTTLLKTVRQNKFPFAILTLSFLFFLGAILLGGRLIYRIEAERLSSQVADSLDRDVKTVRTFFSACLRDVEFIKDVPGLAAIISGREEEEEERRNAESMLLLLMKSHPEYRSFTFSDRHGMEQLSLLNNPGGKARISRRSHTSRASQDSFIGALGLGRDRVYSFFSTQANGMPAAMISSPVYTPGGVKVGVVTVDIALQNLLEHLSHGTFFHNCSPAIHRQEQGPHLPFAGTEGTISVSDTESIPYRLLEYLPGSTVWMAQRFSSSPFKRSMLKIEAVSVGILAAFFLSVLVIGFFNVRHLRTVSTVQKAIIHALANLSEWRDPETGSHLERTRNFCVLLARTLRTNPKYGKTFTNSFIDALYDAVPLHDIGKVGIRDEILLKQSRLTTEEFESMKQHVLIGSDIIQDIIDRFRLRSRFLELSKNICRCHHEKYDGSGYPDGLRGAAIPIEARIFAICDVYDALRAKRPYKDGLSHQEAVATILPDRGIHFDPDVVDAFIACNERFYEIFQAYQLFDETYGKRLGLRSKDALKIRWTGDLDVGISVIDSQHKEFIDRVNSLFASIVMGEGRKETLREMKFLRDYAVHHFGTEETIMERHQYPSLQSHKGEHASFLRNLIALRDDLQSEDDISSAHVVRVNAKVVAWIVGHIMQSDRKFGEFLSLSSGRAGWAAGERKPKI
jgi:hemerythrin-like metal-binding protein